MHGNPCESDASVQVVSDQFWFIVCRKLENTVFQTFETFDRVKFVVKL